MVNDVLKPATAHGDEESCKTCRFTKVMPNGRRVCRHSPPGPQPPDSDSGLVFVHDDWWCGEYKVQP